MQLCKDICESNFLQFLLIKLKLEKKVYLCVKKIDLSSAIFLPFSLSLKRELLHNFEEKCCI